MINSLKIKEIYNKRAHTYEKLMNKIRYISTLKSIINSLSVEIPGNANILDLGCGTGLATEVLLIRFPSSRITGLDYSEEMIKIYKSRFPSSPQIIYDFNENIPLPDNSFNLIISTGALSEYGNIEKVIPNIYKLLKKKGIFINIGIKKNVMSIFTRKFWHYKPAGKKLLISACKNSGFSQIESIKIPARHFPTNYMKFIIKALK